MARRVSFVYVASSVLGHLLQLGQSDSTDFWAWHVIDSDYTGPANKDLGNGEMVVLFISVFGFGQYPGYSDYNSEEHVDDTVLEYVKVEVNSWGQYLSCCPPGSKTNTAEYYRCNSWTTEAHDNCHTLNLPWNDGQITDVGAQVPKGALPIGGNTQWMYSFPSEGEGTTWTQGTARRIKTSTLAWYWVDQAGGCTDCQGKDIEDPCYGNCINNALQTTDLLALTNDALGDFDGFPNQGITGDDLQAIMFDGTSKCLEVSAGNSAYGTAIDLWDCNGLVNQAWSWASDDTQIKLGGHNEPGMCIDLPDANPYNGNLLQLWGCNGGDGQQWDWDSGVIRYHADPNYCIDLPAGDTGNGNRLWLWECNDQDSQNWYIYKGANSDSGNHMPMGNRSQKVSKKPRGGTSWMHNIKKLLTSDVAHHMGSNLTMSADWVPWHEKKHVKDWYAAQLPGPGLPRPLVPKGWKGYNSTRSHLPKVTVLV